MQPTPILVSPAESEHLLAELTLLPGDPRLGFFGPGSITWQVNRESAVFLGAGRAALLQLAHPWVAASLAHHSNLLHDAIGRFHSTFRVLYTMLFGTRAQALAAARQLHRRHATIEGQLPQAVGSHPRGELYQANQTSALLWVHATLLLSAVDAYNLVLPPLTPAQRETYYAESKRMAALFGIPPTALPPDWTAFTRYTDGMLSPTNHDLAIDPAARALGASVLSGVGTRIRPPRWYHALTSGWMPPHLRDQFALPWSPHTQQSAARSARWLPLVYRDIPRPLRSVGPFHEATACLCNRQPRRPHPTQQPLLDGPIPPPLPPPHRLLTNTSLLNGLPVVSILPHKMLASRLEQSL